MRLLVLVLLSTLSMVVVGDRNTQVTANSKAAGLTQCVEPTGYMRRYHMELLFHQRDKTMHQGFRTKKNSLVECIECHAEKDTEDTFIPINAQGQFCQSCHAIAAVKIDCFQCHATKPEVTGLSAGPLFQGMARDVAMAGPKCTGPFRQ